MSQVLLFLLGGWFVSVMAKYIDNYHNDKNKNFSKWKMVNNWGKGGNSVRRNVSSIYKKL